jgi:hypothetical protein
MSTLAQATGSNAATSTFLSSSGQIYQQAAVAAGQPAFPKPLTDVAIVATAAPLVYEWAGVIGSIFTLLLSILFAVYFVASFTGRTINVLTFEPIKKFFKEIDDDIVEDLIIQMLSRKDKDGKIIKPNILFFCLIKVVVTFVHFVFILVISIASAFGLFCILSGILVITGLVAYSSLYLVANPPYFVEVLDNTVATVRVAWNALASVYNLGVASSDAIRNAYNINVKFTVQTYLTIWNQVLVPLFSPPQNPSGLGAAYVNSFVSAPQLNEFGRRMLQTQQQQQPPTLAPTGQIDGFFSDTLAGITSSNFVVQFISQIFNSYASLVGFLDDIILLIFQEILALFQPVLPYVGEAIQVGIGTLSCVMQSIPCAGSQLLQLILNAGTDTLNAVGSGIGTALSFISGGSFSGSAFTVPSANVQCSGSAAFGNGVSCSCSTQTTGSYGIYPGLPACSTTTYECDGPDQNGLYTGYSVTNGARTFLGSSTIQANACSNGRRLLQGGSEAASVAFEHKSWECIYYCDGESGLKYQYCPLSNSTATEVGFCNGTFVPEKRELGSIQENHKMAETIRATVTEQGPWSEAELGGVKCSFPSVSSTDPASLYEEQACLARVGFAHYKRKTPNAKHPLNVLAQQWSHSIHSRTTKGMGRKLEEEEQSKPKLQETFSDIFLYLKMVREREDMNVLLKATIFVDYARERIGKARYPGRRLEDMEVPRHHQARSYTNLLNDGAKVFTDFLDTERNIYYMRREVDVGGSVRQEDSRRRHLAIAGTGIGIFQSQARASCAAYLCPGEVACVTDKTTCPEPSVWTLSTAIAWYALQLEINLDQVDFITYAGAAIQCWLNYDTNEATNPYTVSRLFGDIDNTGNDPNIVYCWPMVQKFPWGFAHLSQFDFLLWLQSECNSLEGCSCTDYFPTSITFGYGIVWFESQPYFVWARIYNALIVLWSFFAFLLTRNTFLDYGWQYFWGAFQSPQWLIYSLHGPNHDAPTVIFCATWNAPFLLWTLWWFMIFVLAYVVGWRAFVYLLTKVVSMIAAPFELLFKRCFRADVAYSVKQALVQTQETIFKNKPKLPMVQPPIIIQKEKDSSRRTHTDVEQAVASHHESVGNPFRRSVSRPLHVPGNVHRPPTANFPSHSAYGYSNP